MQKLSLSARQFGKSHDFASVLAPDAGESEKVLPAYDFPMVLFA